MRTVDFSEYKFRCHALGKLMTGVKYGLTEKQQQLLTDLQHKNENGTITEKQLIRLGELLSQKHAKPTLARS